MATQMTTAPVTIGTTVDEMRAVLSNPALGYVEQGSDGRMHAYVRVEGVHRDVPWYAVAATLDAAGYRALYVERYGRAYDAFDVGEAVDPYEGIDRRTF